MSSYFGLGVLIVILIVFAFMLGFGAGIRYFLEKLHKVLSYDVWKSIIDALEIDANRRI